MRSSRRSSARAGLAIAAALVVAAPRMSAHRRDEYLQAARLAIEPDRVDIALDLTPGIALATAVTDDIDRDGSGVISEAEARGHALAVLRDLTLALDGRPLPLALIGARAASLDAFHHGEGAFHLDLRAPLPRLAGGAHRISFRNAHRTDIGVYLANVLVPSTARVVVTGLHRDATQRDFAVDYRLTGDGLEPAGARGWVAPLVGVAGVLAAMYWRRRRSGRDGPMPPALDGH